jgi:hypothetical protein
MATHTLYQGCTFTRQSLHDALDSHQRAGLIRGWRLRPLDRDVKVPELPEGARPNWQGLVILSDGQPEPVVTVWELHALLSGLASARHILARLQASDSSRRA